MARPKKEIDYELVRKLANMQCSQAEIASVVGVSVRTLQRDELFHEIYDEGVMNGRVSLRRAQFNKAIDGNVPMLIWLGKQVLGQKEKIENEDTINLSENITTLTKTVLENIVPNRDLKDFE